MVELVVLSVIHAAELSAYSEWGHKLSSRVFMHLLNPDEVLRTTGFSKGIISLVVIVVESVLTYFLLNRIFHWITRRSEDQLKRSVFISLAFNVSGILVGLVISFLFMRGGVQQIPINIDAAYFSNQAILNDLSVNSSYYFGNSFFLFNKSPCFFRNLAYSSFGIRPNSAPYFFSLMSALSWRNNSLNSAREVNIR